MIKLANLPRVWYIKTYGVKSNLFSWKFYKYLISAILKYESSKIVLKHSNGGQIRKRSTTAKKTKLAKLTS